MAKFQVGDRVAIVGEAGHTGTIVDVSRPTMGSQHTRIYSVRVDGPGPNSAILRLGQLNLEHLAEEPPIPNQTRRRLGRPEPEQKPAPEPDQEGEPDAAPKPQLPPPGWYEDPERLSTQRWWDGTAWTEHRMSSNRP